MTHIWVIGLDYGTEGKQAPSMAFFTEREAELAKTLAELGHAIWYIAEVPIWMAAGTHTTPEDSA